MSPDEIRIAVDRILVDEFEMSPDRICRTALLRDDLGLDSLDAVDLVIAIEITFKCRITEAEAQGIRTVGDIYDRVATRLGQTRGAST